MTNLRSIPSVDHLFQTDTVNEFVVKFGRSLTLKAIRVKLEDIRKDFPRDNIIPSETEILARVEALLKEWSTPTLKRVINATGVILHTNLGRAPLSEAALQAIQNTAGGYATLEYDLFTGQRGSRTVHAEDLLIQLTGGDAALVVNNCASAVLLVLTALAKRRGVVIARSQLVEIGGGFRIPEVMQQSGARLVEIGTTNRVHLSDYEKVISESGVALVLHVHRSNFQIIGFTSEPTLADIVQAAHQAGMPVVDDLGSGALIDTAQYGLIHEPMVQESLAAGVDLVCFSGDKLLGGPQAGIIVGCATLISKLKKHPLVRAIRADKMCLVALAATLTHYLKEESNREIPVWRMIATPPDQLLLRANTWATHLGYGEVIPGKSTIGGGSLPEETLESYLLALRVPNPNRVLAKLRQASPPIIARLEEDKLVFDPRTVLPEQDETLINEIMKLISPHKPHNITQLED